ncbi:MAG TPA: MarR family transcriptional regulator [Devosia sp.]|nr:MarR family transcriptional regulator [Devosia sp.]
MNFVRDRSSGYLTNWAARLFARAIDRRLTKLGVNSAYMPVFFALANGESLSQTALANLASVEQPTMAATLKRMDRDGLIARSPDPADGRSALVSLTPVAKKKLRGVQAAGHEVNDVAFSGLTAKEQAQYLDLLRRVIASLESDSDPSKL